MSTTLYGDPHFIKPLFPGFEDELLIPADYMKYLNGPNGETAMLRSRREGKLWPVKITCRQFGDGWKQFVQDHDLQIGDCLLFRHEGNLVFYVLVFGHNTCEREYSPFVEVQEQNLPDSSSDPPFTALQEGPTETEEHNLARDFRSVRPLVTATVGESIEDQEQNLPNCSIGAGSKLERNMKRKNVFEAKASSSGSKHPNCVVMVTPDSIRDKRLNIPLNFVALCGLNPILQRHPIRFGDSHYYMPVILSYSSSEKKFYIEGDWISYHIVEKLKAGDVLMIEFVKNREVFKLTKNPEFTREPTCQNSSDESGISKKLKTFGKAPEAEFSSSSVTDKSCCRMRVATLTGNESQPYISLQRGYLLNKEHIEVILRDQEGRSLPAELVNFPCGIRIADGWREFAAANEFKLREELVLEFIENGERPIVKIYGFREFTGKNRSSASDLSHFFVDMKDYYSNSQSTILSKIARKYRYAIKNCSVLRITNELGKSWKVSVWRCKRSEVEAQFSWIKFFKGNRIGEDDVFMLELVKGGDVPELKYYALKK